MQNPILELGVSASAMQIARLCGAKEEPEGHQDRDPPDKEATKLTPEREMWGILKESEFYHNMHISVSTGRALPLIDWLRMILQIPSHIRVKELVRIFDEEVRIGKNATACCTDTQRGRQGCFDRLNLCRILSQLLQQLYHPLLRESSRSHT